MVTETDSLANLLDVPSEAEGEEILPIYPDELGARQGMKSTRAHMTLHSPKSSLTLGTWNVRMSRKDAPI